MLSRSVNITASPEGSLWCTRSRRLVRGYTERRDHQDRGWRHQTRPPEPPRWTSPEHQAQSAHVVCRGPPDVSSGLCVRVCCPRCQEQRSDIPVGRVFFVVHHSAELDTSSLQIDVQRLVSGLQIIPQVKGPGGGSSMSPQMPIAMSVANKRLATRNSSNVTNASRWRTCWQSQRLCQQSLRD